MAYGIHRPIGKWYLRHCSCGHMASIQAYIPWVAQQSLAVVVVVVTSEVQPPDLRPEQNIAQTTASSKSTEGGQNWKDALCLTDAILPSGRRAMIYDSYELGLRSGPITPLCRYATIEGSEVQVKHLAAHAFPCGAEHTYTHWTPDP